MQILNCTQDDLKDMFALYDEARDYQQKKATRHWQSFEPSLVKKEIEEKRQWKIMEGDTIACIFLTAYEDPYIWGTRNEEPAIYLHRIVTRSAYRGRNYTAKIIAWAKEHGKKPGKKFIRMDTWGDNPKLIDYYISCGFTFLETITPTETTNLPAHYSCISLSLFEIKIE